MKTFLKKIIVGAMAVAGLLLPISPAKALTVSLPPSPYAVGDTIYADGISHLTKLNIGSLGDCYKVIAGLIPGWGSCGTGLTDGDKGDITVSSSGATWTIDNQAVDLAKIQNITAGKLLGRTGSNGSPNEISIGTGLSLVANTLSNTSLAVPGGTEGSVQFNSGGNFSGDSTFIYDPLTFSLGVAGDFSANNITSNGQLYGFTIVQDGNPVLIGSGTAGNCPEWTDTYVMGDSGSPCGAGSGTVTNTGGNLTADSIVLGAGTVDTKVVAGITTDGTSQINLGVVNSVLGKLKLFGSTSGNVTLQPNAVAGSNIVLTLPATTGTLVTGGGTASGTNTGDQTITLTGDVTGTGTGSFATTIAANSVALTTDTTGNYVGTITTSTITGLSGGAGGSEGTAITLTLDESTALSGDVSLATNREIFGTSGIIFEGASVDTVETYISVAEPKTTDKTITIPNRSGTVSLSGDTFTGDVTGTLDVSGTTTLTVASDSVALTTDTTGNYVANVAGTANEITSTHTPGEGSTATLSLPSALTFTGKTVTGGSFSTPTLTTPRFDDLGHIDDSNGNELVIFDLNASAVNEITLSNGVTGVNPKLLASGETNVGLDFQPKGTGVFRFLSTASGPSDIRWFEDTDNGSNYNSLIAPASMSSDLVQTLPGTTGTLSNDNNSLSLQNKDLSNSNNTLARCTDPIWFGDIYSNLTTGTGKQYFTIEGNQAVTITSVEGRLITAGTGATLVTIDINEAGTSIISTKLTFDASETTTTTAATPAVISDSAWAADALGSVDIDAVGNTTPGNGGFVKVCYTY